jgi:hypothetical protein
VDCQAYALGASNSSRFCLTPRTCRTGTSAIMHVIRTRSNAHPNRSVATTP